MKKKFLRAFEIAGVFLGLLFLIYLIHIRFFSVNVVFYAAIADGVLATALTWAILFIPRYSVFDSFEKTLLIVIGLVMGYSYAISVPTVLDRSLSFYILEKIDQRGGGILKNRFADVFTKEYLVEHRLVDVRLTEQLESGTIEDKDGCIVLTQKGTSIVQFSRWFRQNLLPKKRLLMGEYTDDLTDPFRNSKNNEAIDYRCSK